MIISVELSLYPLTDEYIPPIKTFIEQLKTHKDVDVITNTMNTQLYGEFDAVMRTVEQVLKNSFETYEHQVLVAKFLNSDRHPSRMDN